MKRRLGCAVVGFLLFVLSLAAQTASSGSTFAVPPLIQFSNVATDEGGDTLSGVVSITFSLYASQQGGEPLWTETQNNVQLDSTGHYSVQLGITQPNGVPTTLFTTDEARWLGVRIAEQVEQPRVLLLSVPYALKAGDAATIGGLPPSAFVLAAPPNGAISGPTADSATAPSAPPPSTAITGTGTVDYLPLWDSTSDIISSVLFQSGTGTTAKIGINTATPATTLDVKGAATIRGTLSLPATSTATATAGKDSQPLNLTASAFNSTSSTAVNQVFQWQSEPASNDTTTPSGTLNLLFGEGATKPSETGLHIANTGQITFATGQTFPGTGDGTLTGITTAAGSGLTGGGTSGTLNLSLTNACAANQVLQYNGSAWICAAVGTGTITGVTAGTDLTGGGTSGKVTLNLNTAATNALYAQLSAANTFTGNQTLNGTITATSSGTAGTIAATTTNATSVAVSGVGPAFGMYGTATSTSGVGVQGYASAASGPTVGVFGQTSSTSGTGVQGSAQSATGAAYGVQGVSNSSGGVGVFGANNALTGTAMGVSGTTVSTTGYGVYGDAVASSGATAGVLGASNSPYGDGVLGENIATTGAAPGVYGTTASSAGYGVEGSVNSPTGSGVVGSNEATTGTAAGVYGLTESSSGYGVEGTSPEVGVYGASSGASTTGSDQLHTNGVWGDYGGTSGVGVGVLGTTDSGWGGAFANASPFYASLVAENYTSDYGGEVFLVDMPNLLGETTAIIGDPGCGESSGNWGLQLSQGGMSGCTNYTLVGNNSGGTYLNANSGQSLNLRVGNGEVVQVSAGAVSITGTLSKGGGSFKIDHPLDPANKYLYHSFVESPDMKNIYDGTVTTDEAGLAKVTLPDWFEALNRDFRYQLTVIGQFAQAIVASEVSQNQFSIRTDKPNVKVSWQVTGIRQDAFANANRIPVEVEKAPADRGHYLYPEVIGQPASTRIGYDAMPSSSEQIVQHQRLLPLRHNASASPQRAPLTLPTLPMPVLPKVLPLPHVAPLPHPVAQASRLVVDQK